MRSIRVIPVLMLLVAGCSSGTNASVASPESSTTQAPTTTSAPDDGCAHVVDAEVEPDDGGRYRVSATVASQETGWDKYADRWEVRDPATGAVLGERILAHPHVDEQPFTRSLRDVAIPGSVASVEIAAHDSVLGFCGTVFTAEVPSG